MLRPEHSWVVIRIRSRADGLWAAYEDDAGITREPPPIGTVAAEWTPVSLRPAFLSPNISAPGQPMFAPHTMFVPFDLRHLIQEAQPAPPGRLPVFVQPPPRMEIWPWESAIDGILQARTAAVWPQVARLARETWRQRDPLRLPLKILPIELDALAALEGVRGAAWYVGQPHVRAYGLHIGFAEKNTVRVALRHDPPHIVIAPAPDTQQLLDAIADLPGSLQPRLLIVTGTVPNEWDLTSLPLPPGISMIRTPVDADARRFVEEIVFAIIHDQPLHDAVAQARDALQVSGLLVSDPEATYDLGLAVAGRAVLDETAALERAASSGDVAAFLDRVGPGTPDLVQGQLRIAARLQATVREVAQAARTQEINFDHESLGLAPVSKIAADLPVARAARAQADEMLRQLALDPEARRVFEQHQQRSVDVTMDRLERGLYRSVGLNEWITPASRCRVTVAIGQRSKQSVVVSEPVPLDPLLPDLGDESGHTLDIVVFEKDFSLISPRVQSVWLPRLGGSLPVHFELRAPGSTGPAYLRVSVYHRNHLLQSFAVSAQIGPIEGAAAEPSISARLDFAETERFANLEELGPRVLSLAVNRDADGTHSLFVKKDDEASAPLQLTEAVMNAQTTRFRAILQTATAATADMDPSDGAVASPQFEQAVRELAELGSELAAALWSTTSGPLEQALGLAADPGEGVIQIARHDPNFVFPWQIVYDYDLPPRIHGMPPRPVCVGRSLVAPVVAAPASYAALDGPTTRAAITTVASPSVYAGCPHNPGIDVCCIHGFWGVRYQIEQLIGESTSRDARSKIEKPRGRPGVCAATAATDADAAGVIATLKRELGSAFAELPVETGIDELFWDPAQRPALFLALGHLETAPRLHEPEGPRIGLLRADRRPDGPTSPGKWLHEGYLMGWKKARRKGWEGEPRPVVLLMACSAGATEIHTLNNLVKSLNGLGAAAIVGTESPVYSRLVARFSREVVVDVWKNGAPLGRAMQSFNERLLKAGNPLGFVFTLLGTADLRFV